jgi:hypothetical protein
LLNTLAQQTKICEYTRGSTSRTEADFGLFILKLIIGILKMLHKKITHKLIKPKAYKNKDYLNYMHNSGNACIICFYPNIELHHLKDRIILGRDDSKVVPLCPEHHRGKYSPHGANSKEFYEECPKEWLLQIAEEFYEEYNENN